MLAAWLAVIPLQAARMDPFQPDSKCICLWRCTHIQSINRKSSVFFKWHLKWVWTLSEPSVTSSHSTVLREHSFDPRTQLFSHWIVMPIYPFVHYCSNDIRLSRTMVETRISRNGRPGFRWIAVLFFSSASIICFRLAAFDHFLHFFLSFAMAFVGIVLIK